jgi:LAS superfamily LD-carboxypeptidase LdcB
MSSLNLAERKFTNRILNVNPEKLGAKSPFFSREIPNNLVKTAEKEMRLGEVDVNICFLPKPVYDDFIKMNEQMKNDIGKELYVESGYRSPGYQAYLFLFYFPENGYSLKENVKWLTFPGHSEHNSINTAVDFINQDGISGEDGEQKPEDFTSLQEYKWLEANAGKYNFYLSYPPNNQFGISFEPWHWHWEIKN